MPTTRQQVDNALDDRGYYLLQIHRDNGPDEDFEFDALGDARDAIADLDTDTTVRAWNLLDHSYRTIDAYSR